MDLGHFETAIRKPLADVARRRDPNHSAPPLDARAFAPRDPNNFGDANSIGGSDKAFDGTSQVFRSGLVLTLDPAIRRQ